MQKKIAVLVLVFLVWVSIDTDPAWAIDIGLDGGSLLQTNTTLIGELGSTSNPASVSANSCANTQVTVTNSLAGATCVVGLPAGFGTSNLMATCFISSNDIGQLHLCNITGSPITPPTGTYTLRAVN